MTSARDPGEGARLAVAAVGSVERREATVAGALAALAEAIDERTCSIAPRPLLVLPMLDALATAAASGPAPAAGTDPDPVAATTAAARLAGVRPEPEIGPGLVGVVHEALLDATLRHRRGAFYTPADVADRLLAVALGDAPWGSAPGTGSTPTICDPASGGGVFLLAAADALHSIGVPADEIVGRCLWGIDIDPLAVAVAQASLIVWARAHGADIRPDVVSDHLVIGDTLGLGIDAWPAPPPGGGFDLVIGNPPFQSQLGSATARTRPETEALRDRWGPSVVRYADTAAVFLLAASHLVPPGGRVALIVPVPLLVSGDARLIRAELLERARLRHLWIAGDALFDAGVRVCAPVLEVGSAAMADVGRSLGRSFAEIDPATVAADELAAAGTWGTLVADVFGVPVLAPDPGVGTLGDFCTATAGFRDQYYGLAPFVGEADDGNTGRERTAKLVTSGLIDPARCLWGRRSTRFAGRRWDRPVVDRDRLALEDRSLASWTQDRLVPKVVVATQTRVLEAAVDVDGSWFPSVPTIALTPVEGRLWDAAAVVLAPPTSVWAMSRHIGAALSADALKISAKQLLAAPLPADRDAWSHGVVALRAASAADDGGQWRAELERFGRAMTLAYAAPDEVFSWWLERLPPWR